MVKIYIVVFLVLTLRNLVRGYQHFGSTYFSPWRWRYCVSPNVDTCLQSSKWCCNSDDQNMNMPEGFTNQFGNHWCSTMLKSWILQVKNVQYDPHLRFFLLRDSSILCSFSFYNIPCFSVLPQFGEWKFSPYREFVSWFNIVFIWMEDFFPYIQNYIMKGFLQFEYEKYIGCF